MKDEISVAWKDLELQVFLYETDNMRVPEDEDFSTSVVADGCRVKQGSWPPPPNPAHYSAAAAH